MLESASQMLKLIREPCRNGRKHRHLPTTLLRPVRRQHGGGSLPLSSQRRSREKGSVSAAFVQPLARRLAHPSPARLPAAHVRGWKMTSSPPCFQSCVGSPRSPSAAPVLFSRATHSLQRKWFLELSGGFVSIRSFQSCPQVDPSLCSQQAVVNQRCQPYSC